MLFLKVAALRKMHLSPFSHQVKVFLGLLQFTYVNVLQASGDAFFLFQFVWELYLALYPWARQYLALITNIGSLSPPNKPREGHRID